MYTGPGTRQAGTQRRAAGAGRSGRRGGRRTDTEQG